MALVTLLVMGWSLAAQAAPPAFTGTGITAPLSSAPEYRQPGATFTVTFDYQSDPDIIPRVDEGAPAAAGRRNGHQGLGDPDPEREA